MTEKIRLEALKRGTGQALVILSVVFYGCLLMVPFIPFPAEKKILLSSSLVILGEASFWIAVMILGRQIIAKYRRVPWRSWIERWFKNDEKPQDAASTELVPCPGKAPEL